MIPNETAANIAVNSNGDLTGFLNLTIDNAPTKPSDKEMLPLITDVIPKVMIGNKSKVAASCRDLIQLCLAITKLIKSSNEDITRIINVVPKSMI